MVRTVTPIEESPSDRYGVRTEPYAKQSHYIFTICLSPLSNGPLFSFYNISYLVHPAGTPWKPHSMFVRINNFYFAGDIMSASNSFHLLHFCTNYNCRGKADRPELALFGYYNTTRSRPGSLRRRTFHELN